jgi:hypothetical protein
MLKNSVLSSAPLETSADGHVKLRIKKYNVRYIINFQKKRQRIVKCCGNDRCSNVRINKSKSYSKTIPPSTITDELKNTTIITKTTYNPPPLTGTLAETTTIEETEETLDLYSEMFNFNEFLLNIFLVLLKLKRHKKPQSRK